MNPGMNPVYESWIASVGLPCNTVLSVYKCVTTMEQLFTIFLLIIAAPSVYGFVEGLYCGTENCYAVLGVTRESERSDIARAYRSLARKYHPDKYKGEDAAEKFQSIATAYEILRDEEERENYNYMLDHPEMVYSHYYRYYKKRVTPKVDPKIVVAVSITVISLIQYFSWWSRYHSAIDYLLVTPKYRLKAMDIAKKEGLLNNNAKKRGRRKKEEIKAEEDKMLRKVIEENADIKGGYSKPKVTDILWFQLVFLPMTIAKYIYWWLSWIWRFNICGQELGLEEKHYLIRSNFNISQSQYESIEEHEKDVFLRRQLWIKANHVVYKAEKEEEMKTKMAESAKYKSYRRYMKNHGTGRMTFED
ncbi:hypothetical protein BSL78_14959 [Apostichopus japonicus]|uniref:J domain-containing protein n=1 Tax=Stichopus japonicus TaxID=307972 RepID=A0A2G8KJM2_STIJA|nr:hypothetical protein BSL78_14959 [Apostichopus japonicus]